MGADPRKVHHVNPEAKAVAERINKKLGAGTVIPGLDIDYTEIPRITSGSLALDVALGGGWPAKQWHEVIGDESHGKTSLVLKTLAANQAQDPDWTVVWIAAEEFVPRFAVQCGCDLSRILVVDTNLMEEAYQAACDFLESRAIDAIVIDSLPALTPSEEGEKGMADAQISLAARLTGKFFRKARKSGRRSLVERERLVTGFMVNQWREKVGVLFGDPRVTPGGRGKNYHYFTRVEVRRDDWIDNEKTGKDKEHVGQTIKISVIKNKSAPPRRTAVVDFYFADFRGHNAGDFDRAKDVFVTALQLDVVERVGAYYRYEDHQWQGRTNVLEALDEDPALLAEIEQDVLAIVRAEQRERAEQVRPLKVVK